MIFKNCYILVLLAYWPQHWKGENTMELLKFPRKMSGIPKMDQLYFGYEGPRAFLASDQENFKDILTSSELPGLSEDQGRGSLTASATT